MDTLTNVNTRGGGLLPPDAGLASGIIPETESASVGVSVRYAPDPDKQWFVLRASYNRTSVAYEYITRDQTEAYMPVHHVLKFVSGGG